MPQEKAVPHTTQRASGGFFFAGIREFLHCPAQESELRLHVAAPVADCQVNAQGEALAESELAIFALRQQAGGFLAGQHHGLANQFFSRHRRRLMRARCSITQQCVALIPSSLQISVVSNPRCSRIMKTRAVRSGSARRQASSAARNCFCPRAPSGCCHSSGASRQWPRRSNRPSNSSRSPPGSKSELGRSRFWRRIVSTIL